MATYESYKDSGVQWLGDIPSHWEVKKLRAFFERRNHKVSDTEFAPLSVTKNGIVPQMENVAKSQDSENRRLVKIDDFVINSRSDRKGSSGVSSLEGSVSFVNTVMIPGKQVFPPFSNYLLKSYAFVEENYRNGHGIVADLWTTSFDEQKLIKLAMPPFKEQKAIVAYLDKVTGEIDRTIEAQQKMIEALNERKQIIITRAVTRGLNPNAPLRDSGIDWLGQIPAHWKMRKLKWLIASPLQYGANESPDDYSESLPRYIRITDISINGTLKKDGAVSLAWDKASKYMLTKGDVLFARSGATVGKTYLYTEDSASCFAGYLIKAECNEQILPEFLVSFTQSSVYENWKNYIFNKATIQNIGADKYSTLMVPLPLIEEQKRILERLKHNISPINQSIYHCERMISLLLERKQIIINEVVTGKKKVI